MKIGHLTFTNPAEHHPIRYSIWGFGAYDSPIPKGRKHHASLEDSAMIG